jgi:hypothetical protein
MGGISNFSKQFVKEDLEEYDDEHMYVDVR